MHFLVFVVFVVVVDVDCSFFVVVVVIRDRRTEVGSMVGTRSCHPGTFLWPFLTSRIASFGQIEEYLLDKPMDKLTTN